MASVSPDLRGNPPFTDDDPPSPSAISRPIDIPTNTTFHSAHSWESVGFGQPSAGLAYTPSYGGSFGSNRDSVWGDQDASAVYGSGAAADFFDDKYEPESYVGDPSAHQSPFLLMDEQAGFQAIGANDSLFPGQDPASGMAVAFGEVDQSHQFSPRPEVFAAGSPASSIGFVEAANAHESRSRASSVSSNHGAQSSPFAGTANYSPQPLYNDFNKLTFGMGIDSSPSWAPQQITLPSLNTQEAPLTEMASPPIQAKSPPQLVIPGEPSPAMPSTGTASASTQQDSASSAGAQPAINLVPATPVSGGGLGGGIKMPFQQMLANLTRERNLRNGGFGRGNTIPEAQPAATTFQPTVLGDQGAAHTQTQPDAMTWSSIVSASGQSQGTGTASQAALPHRVYHHGYNVPLVPEFNSSQQRSNFAMHNSTTLPPFSHTHSDPTRTSSLGEPSFSTTSSAVGTGILGLNDTSFLTASLLTRHRSKSDTSTRPPAWSIQPPPDASPALTLTSEFSADTISNYPLDLASTLSRPQFSMLSGLDLDMSLGMGDAGVRRANSDGGRHRRNVKSEDLSASFRGPRLVPTSSSEFIRSITTGDGALAPIDPRVGGSPGPQRRRGSGSGHERTSSLSSLRSTPYQRPSPHTSPGGSPHHSPTSTAQPLPPSDPQYMRVERPLVTTPATKTASANRRRAEATFLCPVPGCGSTFTRHFNLRGHLRSHNEERPFKCKWPGCEKGFARQHDCKRHEALHLNIRPYTCEGCQKTFARMDALNRHLRSEGGVDCAKVHQPTDGAGEDASTGVTKTEPDSNGSWSQSLVM